MGKQHAQYRVGREGNVIYYELNGGYYARSVPAKVKQTKATKIRSSNFAVAVRTSRLLRCLLKDALPFPKDKLMQNRLNGAIMNWLKLQTPAHLQPAANLPFIHDFQFNPSTSVKERLQVPVIVSKIGSNTLQVYMPAFDTRQQLKAPAWTNKVTVTIAAASCLLTSSVTNGNDVNTFTIPYCEAYTPEHTIDLSLPMPPGSLVVVAVSLAFFISKKGKEIPTDKTAFMPAGIVTALYM